MAKHVEMLIRTCEYCEGSFTVPPCTIKTQAARFCNIDCLRRFQEPATQLRLKVDRSGGLNACWPWTGRRDKDGYGLLWHSNKRFRAHRVAWELANAQVVPDGLVTRHRCPGGGNPWCCNPAHLQIGTVADNNGDTVQDGRSAFGERSGKTTLTQDQVIAIRVRRAAGESRNALAREFSVTRSCISHIVQGRVWRHVPMATPSRHHAETGR